MAIFSDQFDRRPLMGLKAPDVLEGRLNVVIDSARMMLYERRTEFDWAKVARAFEKHLQEKAGDIARAWAAESDDPSDLPWMGRKDWSELSLMSYDIESGEEVLSPELPLECLEEELLAVVALWMIADVLDMLEAANGSWHPAALVRALDAARAAEMAHSACRTRLMTSHLDAELRDEVVKRVRQEEQAQARASEIGRNAADQRWKHLSDHQQQALALAESKPFRFKSEAVRHIVQNLERVPGEFYVEKTINKWLKAAGWLPQRLRPKA